MTTPTTTEEPSSIEEILALVEDEEGGEGAAIADMIDDIQTVTISELGKPVEVAYTEGMTVAEALASADIDPTGREFRLNGTDQVNADQVLQAGDAVLLARQIRGATISELPDMKFAQTLGESGFRISDIIETELPAGITYADTLAAYQKVSID